MKKLLAILLCTATLIGAACVSVDAVVFNSETALKRGDLNDDGMVNALDVYLLRSSLVGFPTEYNHLAADFDGNQSEDAVDVYYLRNIIVGIDLLGNTGTQIQRILIGKTEIADFEISVPENASENNTYAANEIQKYIKLARGVELPITVDAEADHKIVIAPDSTGTLGDEGVDILVENGSVYITGGTKRGCLYGVYEFLERFVGWVFINAENEFINENEVISVADGEHYRHIPRVADRDSQTYSYSPYVYDKDGNSYYKQNSITAAVKLKTSSIKNRGEIESSAKFGYGVGYVGGAHSVADYYPGINNQSVFCFTDTEHEDVVIKNVLAKIKKVLAKGDLCDRISVAPMDNYNYCSCRPCRKLYRKHESFMGPQLTFVNNVAAAVAQEYPDVHVLTTAYQYTRKPPKDLVPAENVDILYCWAGCNNHPLDGSKCYEEGNRFRYNNIKENKYFETWCEITKGKIYCWIYATSYSAPLAQASLLPEMREGIRYLADHGVYGIYCEGYYGTSDNFKDGNCFDLLLMYMFIRCQWDPDMTDEEFEAYENEFLYAYYGDGWESVRRYIDMNGESTEKVGCWANNCDIIFDTMSMDYYAEHAEEIYDLMDEAMAGAKNEEQLNRVQHLAASAYWMCLCSTADVLDSGTDAEKSAYGERYATLFNWMTSLNIVNLDDGNGKFNPNDPTVMDPYKWTGISVYHSTRSVKDDTEEKWKTY